MIEGGLPSLIRVTIDSSCIKVGTTIIGFDSLKEGYPMNRRLRGKISWQNIKYVYIHNPITFE